MQVKESKSLLFNNVLWSVSYLGEQVILLECSKETSIEKVHRSTRIIENELGDLLKDVVPAYHSIAAFTSISLMELIDRLEGKVAGSEKHRLNEDIVEIPICYEFGLDLKSVAIQNDLTVDQAIKIHLDGVYRSLFIGFTPGFIYADGLDKKLSCPRKSNPRTKIDAGSIGIGGDQTGIYSLDSPGGWNIIGRTPVKIFSPEKQPPMMIEVGRLYRFYRITEEEFRSWEN